MPNITDFKEKVLGLPENLSRSYYSQLYAKRFLPVTCDYLIKLDPLLKREIARHLGKFVASLPGDSSNLPIKTPEDFYSDVGFHQLYRFRYTHSKKVTEVRFRNTSNKDIVDDFLECLQESVIIRTATGGSDLLDERLRVRYSKQTLNKLFSNPRLLHSREQELGILTGKIKRAHITTKTSFLLNALDLMAEMGYDSKKVIDEIQNSRIRVYPICQYHNDVFLEEIRKELTRKNIIK